MSEIFTLEATDGAARAGTIRTAHGEIPTPAFMPVGTKATVKSLHPDEVRAVRAHVILGNTYHLHLRPGEDVIEELGGLHAFSGWDGPILTDSGGFQVFSLRDTLIAVDDDGVTFRSHLDGSKHRFTPEISIGIQNKLGADIIFAFDELTTLVNTRAYQESSVQRTHEWAVRCLAEHHRLQALSPERPRQALFGVVQGAQYEDLRRQAASGLASIGQEAGPAEGLSFDGYGIGGALEKQNLATIVG